MYPLKTSYVTLLDGTHIFCFNVDMIDYMGQF